MEKYQSGMAVYFVSLNTKMQKTKNTKDTKMQKKIDERMEG